MKLENVLVLIADGVPDSTGEMLYSEGMVIPDKPVPVTRGFGSTASIGSALLRKKGDRVFADIEVNDESFESVLKIAGRYLYPAIGGQATVRDGLHYRQFSINQIAIGPEKNTDSRIPTLDSVRK